MVDVKDINKQSSRDLSEILAKAGISVDSLIVELVKQHKSNYSFANTLLSNLLIKPDPKLSDSAVQLPQIVRTIKAVEAEEEGREITKLAGGDDE